MIQLLYNEEGFVKMNQKILHTPEGVRDIYPLECRQKLALQNKLHDTLKSYAYQDIQTPTLEFSEVFSKEVGSLDSKELYRFFDRDGNILVLRPDITPSIARAVSTISNEEDFYGKFCYAGNTFINHNSYQGRLKENTQLGAEMIGLDSVESDAEMLAMVVDVLRTSGLEEFQVTVSHVGYFNALVDAAKLDADNEKELRELCENKNYFGVDGLLDKCCIDKEVEQAFHVLPELVGGTEIFAKAKEITSSVFALNAIKRLEEISEILDMYGVLEYINFDLSMTGSYGYYTGIIFRAYTFGTGDAIVKGGRYDQLLNHFKTDIPAIGFAITVDDVFNALSRQKVKVPYKLDNHVILYESGMQNKAIRLAKSFRKNGRITEIIKKDETHSIDYYIEYAKKSFGKYILHLLDTNVVEAINLIDGSVEVVDLKVSE